MHTSFFVYIRLTKKRLTKKQINNDAHSKKISTHFVAANTMQSQLPKVCLQKINTCSYRNIILIMIFIHFLSAYSFFALPYSTQFNLIYSTSFRPLHFVTIRLNYWTLIWNENDKSLFKNFINEKFRKWFYFLPVFYLIMWVMKAPKNFGKKNYFENMRADFLRRSQNSLRQTSPKMMDF